MTTQVPSLTKEQAAIVGAFTGFVAGPFSDIHEYVEKIMGRPVWSHEFTSPPFMNEVREAAKDDFVALAFKAGGK